MSEYRGPVNVGGVSSEQEPASRFVLAQSWWIASEIVRRHPELVIIETHPGGGMYDCLSIVAGSVSGPKTLIDLNRVGRIHVHVDAEFRPITWSEALAAPSGHDVVKTVENAAGLSPMPAPPTTAKTVTYRLLARVLAGLVDDRRRWDARNGQLDTSEGVGGPRADLGRFSSVLESLSEHRSDDLLGASAYRFWILLRDEEPLAVLDTDGRLHSTDRPPKDLLPIYRHSGSSLTATIASAMGHLLP